MKGDPRIRNEDSLQELKLSPANKKKKKGTSVLQGPEFWQEPEWSWKWTLPSKIWLPDQSQPGQYLDFHLKRSQAENPNKPTWIFDLQNCEIINGCCAQPLNLWPFIMHHKKGTWSLSHSHLREGPSTVTSESIFPGNISVLLTLPCCIQSLQDGSLGAGFLQHSLGQSLGISQNWGETSHTNLRILLPPRTWAILPMPESSQPPGENSPGHLDFQFYLSTDLSPEPDGEPTSISLLSHPGHSFRVSEPDTQFLDFYGNVWVRECYGQQICVLQNL